MDFTSFMVVVLAVVKGQIHITLELLDSHILLFNHFLLNSWEVHWSRNSFYIVLIPFSQCVFCHRLQESLRFLMVPKCAKNFPTLLHPLNIKFNLSKLIIYWSIIIFIIVRKDQGSGLWWLNVSELRLWFLFISSRKCWIEYYLLVNLIKPLLHVIITSYYSDFVICIIHSLEILSSFCM